MTIEGKTKIIQPTETPGEVLLVTKDSLTGGDAAKKEHIEGIAVHKVTQASNVFRLLNDRGVPTAFIDRHDERSIRCHRCEMLPLELVTRRFAWGSYLKRAPELVSTVSRPHRFDRILTEIFHKHAVVMPPLSDAPVQMEEGAARELFLRDGAWADGVYTDPYVRIDDGRWMLHSAKAPVNPDAALMECPPELSPTEVTEVVENMMIPVFSILEEVWSKIVTNDGPVALVDMKIEIGRRANDGKLAVADVIDNDSWRIWPGADPSKQLDKQTFREGHPLSEVSEKYTLVAALTEDFE